MRLRVLFGLLCLVGTGLVGADEEAKSPNILFCMADDWGWPHAEPYGDQVVRTPTFSRLAREGVLFERAFVSSPSCTPCRSSIISGQQFYRLGVAANLRGALDVNQPNFMFMLRSSGYEIGHYRKAWDPGNYDSGGYTEHPCGPETSFSSFLSERDPKKAFCFWFGTSDPHRSYQAGTGVESGLDLEKIQVPSFFPDTPKVRSDIADYYYEVERWDREVGEALALLEEAGELENTIIVMTGDHGMPFPRCKGNLYDWGVQVPLVVRWGDELKKGERLSEFVSLPDLAPTFLELAGVAPPEVMTGQSLLPLLKTGKAPDQARDFVVMGRERHTKAQGQDSLTGYPSRGLRTDQWLLIQNFAPDRWPMGVGGAFKDCDRSPTKDEVKEEGEDSLEYRLCFGKRPEFELYEVKKDPEQVENLAESPEHAEQVAELRTRLHAYLKETEDPRMTDEEVIFDTVPYEAKRR